MLPLPDYLHDLNAIHGALRHSGFSWQIKTCEWGYCCAIYTTTEEGVDILLSVIHGEELCRVIAVALLRALGKWEDDDSTEQPAQVAQASTVGG
jgi:hypothetical protein